MKLNLFIFIFSFLSITVYPQTYQGTVGKYPITLTIDETREGELEGMYYYNSQLKDIILYGEIDKSEINRYTLSSHSLSDELFELRISGDSLKGTWQKGKKELNVKLVKINDEYYNLKKSLISVLML